MITSNVYEANTLRAYPPTQSAREIALATGDLSQALLTKVETILAENKYSIVRAFKAGLQELLEQNLISPQEFETLCELYERFIAAVRGKLGAAEVYASTRTTYQRLALDQGCSSTALAIASVLNASWKISDSRETNDEQVSTRAASAPSIVITPQSTGAGAAVGAAIGGAFGWGFGGPVGAGIGAAIGAIAGAAIGLCNENGQ